MKRCPKCGETVSCRKWMYCEKMCRKCAGRTRYRRQKLQMLRMKK